MWGGGVKLALRAMFLQCLKIISKLFGSHNDHVTYR